jgi:hypothetical protein
LKVFLRHPDEGPTAPPHECALGFAAVRNDTLGFVTNSHCTQEFMNPDQTQAFAGGPQVATEVRDPSAYTCGVSRCRGADASFLGTTGAVPFGVGLIFRTKVAPTCSGVSYPWGVLDVDQNRPYFVVVQEETMGSVMGQEVHKVGPVTGWTKGTVTATCVDTRQLENSPGIDTVTRCTDEANYAAWSGDSGSPVFAFIDADGFRVKLMGIHQLRAIHFTGGDEGRYSRLSRIKSDLGGQWRITRGVGLQSPVLTGYVNANRNPVISWAPVSGATKYRVYHTYRLRRCDEFTCSWDELADDLGYTTATSLTDFARTVTTYTGSTTNGTADHGYTVFAESRTDYSEYSAKVYFR